MAAISESQRHLERFRELCAQAGLKLTHQRLEIFRELMAADGHPSAEDLFQRLKPRMPTLSLDTVYRSLATFEECGAIARVHVLDDRARFDANTERHHHLVCVRCKGIEDFSSEAVDTIPLPPASSAWGRVESRYLELRGVCRNCLEAEAAA